MTEIPEHLLKRAAEARARAAGEPAGDTGAAETAPAAAAPVPAAAATPAVPEPEPEPVPDPPYVAAAKARKRIPYWVMPVLLFLPIWAVYYVGLLENPPAEGGLAVEGAAVYSQCASCHGGGGGGGVGRQLNDGEVLATFPVGITDAGYDGLAGQLAWIANGTAGTQALEDGGLYGDPARPGGQHGAASFGNMGAFDLPIDQLAAVTFHERSQFGGSAMSADDVIAENALLEEFVVVAGEKGVTSLGGMSYAEVHDLLEEARAALG